MRPYGTNRKYSWCPCCPGSHDNATFRGRARAEGKKEAEPREPDVYPDEIPDVCPRCGRSTDRLGCDDSPD